MYKNELEIATNCTFLNMTTADKFRAVFEHPYTIVLAGL